MLPCAYHQRSSLIKDLITSFGCGGRTIIFTDTKADASGLAVSIAEGR